MQGDEPTPVAPAASESLGRRSFRGAIWALTAQGVTALASLLAFAVMGRMVGHAELGEYVMALVGVGAVQWLALNAWREPLIQAPALGEHIRDSVFWLTLGVACLLLALLSGGAWWLRHTGRGDITAACLNLLAVKLFFDTLSSVPMATCARDLHFSLLARVSISASIVGSLLSMLLLYRGWGVQAVAGAQAVASALSFGLLLWRSAWLPRLHFRLADLAPLRTYSPHVLMWQAVEAFNSYFDRFLVGVRLSVQALGVYGFSRRLNDVIIEVLVGAAGSVALPAYATLQQQPAALRNAYLRSMRIVSFAVFPIIGILFGVAEDLVPMVFGDKWAVAVPIYRCFLLLGAIQTIGILQAALIRSLGHASRWARYQGVQAVANVVTVLAVIDHGSLVLALTVVLRSYLVWGWAVRMTCDLIDMRVRDYLAILARPALGAVLAALAATGSLHAVPAMPVVVLILIATLAGATVYLGMTLATMRGMAGDVMALLRRR